MMRPDWPKTSSRWPGTMAAGYLKIAELLRTQAGWVVNDKGVELWRREGPKVPAKQPKRRRL